MSAFQISETPAAVKRPVHQPDAMDFLEFIGADVFGGNQFYVDDEPSPGLLSTNLKDLTAANREGKAIRVAPPQRNILILKSDGTRSLGGIKQVAGEMSLKPACITEAAPKEYDVYFKLTDEIPDQEFFDRQTQLADAFKCSREISDRVRVPGFWNLKDPAHPWQVRIELLDWDAPSYSAADLDFMFTDDDDDDTDDSDPVAEPSPNVLPLCPLDQIGEMRPKDVNVLCQRWVWVTNMKRFIRRTNPAQQWDGAQFDSEFNYMSKRSQSISKDLFKRRTLLRRFGRPVFEPGGPEYRGNETYNLWRPSGIHPVKGDTTAWNEHLLWLIPDDTDRNLLLDWLAWIVQNPTRTPGYALLLIGLIFGTGKSFVARVMEQIVGPTNTQRPKNSSIRGDFNPWAALCRLAIIEELNQIGRQEVAHELRDMITEPTIEVNPKGINPYKIANRICMMAISNLPDALPVQLGDRRWLVIETPITQEQKDKAEREGHFRRIMPMVDPDKPDTAALAHIAYELLHRKVANFTPGNAPITAAKATMIELSLTPLEKWLTDNMGNDPLTRPFVNIRDDVISAVPGDIIRITRNPDTVIQKFLKARLDGVSVGNVRVNGSVVKVWAINDAGRAIKKGSTRGKKPLDTLGNRDVGAEVEAARAAMGRKADATAQADFGQE